MPTFFSTLFVQKTFYNSISKPQLQIVYGQVGGFHKSFFANF